MTMFLSGFFLGAAFVAAIVIGITMWCVCRSGADWDYFDDDYYRG